MNTQEKVEKLEMDNTEETIEVNGNGYSQEELDAMQEKAELDTIEESSDSSSDFFSEDEMDDMEESECYNGNGDCESDLLG